MTRHYLFGPVRSRRLGLSLGIDLSPLKICSMSCLYCEVGRTTHSTTERREWVPTEAVKAELDEWLAEDGHADYLTFSGSGEPTMHTGIGEIITWIKQRTGIPVAVITNSAHLSDPDVRRALRLADVVLPSLDAVDEDIFQQINRPAAGLTVKMILDGLWEFRREFMGQIWLEVMLCRGINDTDRHLGQLALYLNELRPDKIQINTPVRPGAEAYALPCSIETLERARVRFGPRAEIIASLESIPFQRHQRDEIAGTAEPASDASGQQTSPPIPSPQTSSTVPPADPSLYLEQRIREHLTRRPATVDDMAASLDADPARVQDIVDAMVALGQATLQWRDGRMFAVPRRK